MYKIIRSRSKRQRNTKRVSHLWNNYKQDTYCNRVKSNDLKTSNYWFGDSKSLPKDLCSFCREKYFKLEERRTQQLQEWEQTLQPAHEDFTGEYQ